MKKIAIVDDEFEILEMLKRYLENHGDYEIDVFSNPVEGLERCKDGYDLIMLDIMMPNLNGFTFLEKLLEHKSEQKVIMMTAYSTLDKVIQAKSLGVIDYLMKPFESLKIVESKIDKYLK